MRLSRPVISQASSLLLKCLKCHGTPGVDQDASSQAKIQRLYPQDEATGYAEGDFRGLWSIRWKH
jgi:cytochrome c553